MLVWFRESDDDIDNAMDMLCDMERKVDISKLDWHNDRSELQLNWYVAARYNESVHPGLNKLFNKTWFSRIWVVQEVSLSQAVPILLCRKRSTLFKLLWDLKFHLGIPAIDGFSVQEALGLNSETCSEISNFRVRWNRSASRLSSSDEELLEHLLRCTSRRECTDPRDRVFGLLGMLSPIFVLVHFPDYNEPVAKIYKRMMKLLFMRREVGWLRYAKNKNISDLPSWCIDFSINWINNHCGFLGDLSFSSEDKSCEQSGLINTGELDSILVQGIKLGQIKLSVQRRGPSRTESLSYIPTSVEEEMNSVGEFNEIIRPFFAAVHTILQDQFGHQEACKRVASGDI